jgi:hypothetical protein
MANKVHEFRDRDVKRIAKSVGAAGLKVSAVEVDLRNGRVKVFCGEPKADGDNENFFDREAERLRRQKTEGGASEETTTAAASEAVVR